MRSALQKSGISIPAKASSTISMWCVYFIALFPTLCFGFVRNHAVSTPVRQTKLLMAATPSARELIYQGMELFRRGDVQGSVDKFDASTYVGSDAYLWQRGISYYYTGEFEKGSQQFRDDVKLSPLDVEEIVWDIACLLKLDPTFPVPSMLSLPPGKKDRRPIMVRPNQQRLRVFVHVFICSPASTCLVVNRVFHVSWGSIATRSCVCRA